MSNRIVRPVRAWADYDQWSVYLELEDGKLGFRRYVIPKGGAGRLTESFDVFPGVAAALQGDGPKPGSLNSLRVLYENGYELALEWMFSDEPGFWLWKLRDAQTERASGNFREDKDSEAVERAMIAAAAWFSQRQETEE